MISAAKNNRFMECADKTADFQIDGTADRLPRDMRYLDRHHVSCGQQEFLSYFHLERNTKGDHIRYKYTCCSLK